MVDPHRSWKQRAMSAFGDFHMFLCLCVARYIVWRTLAARRKAERRALRAINE